LALARINLPANPTGMSPVAAFGALKTEHVLKQGSFEKPLT
jgi:hypothetical protein